MSLATPGGAPIPSGPYAAWHISSYRRFAAGWFLLIFGNLIATMAVGIRLYDQTANALALGLAGLVQVLPVLVLSILGGQLADRYDRRRVLLAMLTLGSTVAVGLAVTAAVSAPPGWLYLLLGLGAIGMALGGPARAAILPQIVPHEVFSNAVTWNTSIFRIASMTGPAVGGLLMRYDPSATLAFSLAAACRLGALVSIALLVIPPSRRAIDAVSVDSLLAGVRFVGRVKPILGSLTLDLFAVLFGGMTYLLPIYAKDILRVGPPGVGYLLSAEAVGAVGMAMLLAHLPPMRHAGRTMLWAVAGFGVATIVFGVSHAFWLSMAMMCVMGACDNVSVVVRHTLVQMLTPDAMRGRVSAVNNIFISASNDLGGLESGLTAWAFGPVLSVVGGGIGTLAVVLAAALAWPELRRIGALHELQPEGVVADTNAAEAELSPNDG